MQDRTGLVRAEQGWVRLRLLVASLNWKRLGRVGEGNAVLL